LKQKGENKMPKVLIKEYDGSTSGIAATNNFADNTDFGVGMFAHPDAGQLNDATKSINPHGNGRNYLWVDGHVSIKDKFTADNIKEDFGVNDLKK
jgi:prepilin-type processing-associated H-X9-DG protein